MSSRQLGGRRFVVGLYVALVAFAGGAGVLFARVVENPSPPSFLFVVPLPANEVGFALYGALTVALALGVPLALIALVSRNLEDAPSPDDGPR